MKKLFLTLCALGIFSGVAQAQLTGGFEGPTAYSSTPITIQQALSLADDSIVILQGHIINNLGDEKYTFQDATGQVVVEIDDEKWMGVKVTPADTVEILGEVDKEFIGRDKIDVKTIRVVK